MYVPKSSDPDDSDDSTDDGNFVYLEDGSMQANGCLYWLEGYGGTHLVSRDTATMEFCFEELPLPMGHYYTYDAGETKDGNTCIVYSDRFNIGILMHTRGDNGGVGRWVLDRVSPMAAELKRAMQEDIPENDATEVFVTAVRAGYAYLSTAAMSADPMKPCWFMSLCLETMRLEMLFRRTYECDAHPYIMP